MAWLFGSTKKGPSGQPESKASRDRQISNLQERVPGLQPKSNDKSLFEVEMKAPPNGATVMLRVFLPTKFPAERPVLQLLSQISHPWVNQYMQVVGHPDLHGWDGTNPPMIGDVVAAVIREFGRDNPGERYSGHDQGTASTSWGGQRAHATGFSTAQQTGYAGAGGAGNPAHGIASGGTRDVSSREGRTDTSMDVDSSYTTQRRARVTPSTKTPRRQPEHHTPIPAIPTKFEELQELSTQQLRRLLEDDVARQALLLGMTSVAGMKDLRTDVRKGNVETARSTLSKQEAARNLRGECEQMRNALRELQTSYEGKAHGSNKNMGGTADQVILKQVKHASKMADVSSERVANDFLEKCLPPQGFLDNFLNERQRYHMLAAKIECMKRDIRF